MADPVYIGDIGTEIVLDLGEDVTAATVRSIVAMKPDYTHVHWTATADGTTAIKNVTQAGDLDTLGVWDIQPYVEMPAWKGFGDVVQLVVKPIL